MDDFRYIHYPSSATSGTVGAFYFGGDYTNAEIHMPPIYLDIEPLDVDVSAFANVSSYSDLVIEPYSGVYANANDNFPFDFSGTPRNGGSPLYVDFHAYNYDPMGPFEGKYEASEFRWWFDYENYNGPNDYVSCATDTAVHMYCGGYLQEYDVRLCVVYKSI